MADACVKITFSKMTLFQQAFLLPLLHQFKVILRHFSMYPSVGTMAGTFTHHASLDFIKSFQHIKAAKRDAPNQRVYEQAINHLKRNEVMKLSTAVKMTCLNNMGLHLNLPMPSNMPFFLMKAALHIAKRVNDYKDEDIFEKGHLCQITANYKLTFTNFQLRR